MVQVPNLEDIKLVAKNAGLDDLSVTGVEPLKEAHIRQPGAGDGPLTAVRRSAKRFSCVTELQIFFR